MNTMSAQRSLVHVQAARQELRKREALHDAASAAMREECDDLRHELQQQRQQVRHHALITVTRLRSR